MPRLHPVFALHDLMKIPYPDFVMHYRQHALGHLSAATIPEESPLTNSTSARGCSSNSLADCDNSAGLSTPRPAHSGKHKSLETIDWGAAAAVDESGSCVRLGSRCLVTEVETLPLQ